MKNFTFFKRHLIIHTCIRATTRVVACLSLFISTSSALQAQTQLESNAIKVKPNPVKNTAVIEIESAGTAIKNIVITETTGRILQAYTLSIEKGINRFVINNVGKWQPGLYYVIVQESIGNITGSYKLIKEWNSGRKNLIHSFTLKPYTWKS